MLGAGKWPVLVSGYLPGPSEAGWEDCDVEGPDDTDVEGREGGRGEGCGDGCRCDAGDGEVCRGEFAGLGEWGNVLIRVGGSRLNSSVLDAAGNWSTE
jgi:hypothetical protein